MLDGRGKPVFIISLLVLLVLSAGFLLKSNDESAAVYEAVLGSLGKRLPISEYSFYRNPSRCRLIKSADLPTVSVDVFNDFLKQNDVLLPSIKEFNLVGRDYHIVSREDSLRIYRGKSPELKDIPRQLINLSYVGFAPTATQAMVCVESEESGDIAQLQKTAGRWQVLKWHYIW